MSNPAALAKKKCLPCEGGVPRMNAAEVDTQLKTFSGWTANEARTMISKQYVLKNFAKAVNFINGIAEVAEADNHHPDLHLTGYRNLRIDLSTHAIQGLSENDFILAAKIDALPKELKNS